jgi:hypothetical protein
VLAGVALAVLGVAGTSSSAQSATTFCVGGSPGCYVTIQAALDAAHDGDTISVGRGTFAGGITIEKSVRLAGVGAAATIISGGGPVVTIGDALGDSTPVVSISRLTINGGVNESQPNGAVARGGGVSIRSPGATVAISDSIVAGNRVTPQASGFALGGGIDNAGTLVVLNTRVSNNEVGSAAASGSPAFNARAGGINNQPGAALTLRDSVVTGNRVAVTAANARLAVAGGISDFGGVLSIDDSVVSGNSVEADTATPGEVDSFTGGIEVTAAGSAMITRTTVRDNTVRGVNVGCDAMVGVGGISTDPGVTFVLRDCAVSHNSVYLQRPAARATPPTSVASTSKGTSTSAAVSSSATPSRRRRHRASRSQLRAASRRAGSSRSRSATASSQTTASSRAPRTASLRPQAAASSTVGC